MEVDFWIHLVGVPYCWWFRKSIPSHRLDGAKTLVNHGINYQPQLVQPPDFWTIDSMNGPSTVPPPSLPACCRFQGRLRRNAELCTPLGILQKCIKHAHLLGYIYSNIYIYTYITYYIYCHTWYYIINILHIIYMPCEYCVCGSGSKQSVIFLTIRVSWVLFQ